MMDPSTQVTAIQSLLALGPSGIFLFFIWQLWSENKAKDKTVEGLVDRYHTLLSENSKQMLSLLAEREKE